MRVRKLIQWLTFPLILGCAIQSSAQQPGAVDASPQPSPTPSSDRTEVHPAPGYQQLRYDEDWSYLSDPARRSSVLDRIKYISLNRDRWYLSIGGEVRERYERFNNPLWGQEPADDNGYFMQRYMLHADFHFGSRVRFFGQIESGLENGRKGGPRPTDKDTLDLHQAFGDLRFDFDKDKSLVLRAGRQEISLGSSRLVSFRESPNVRQSFDGLRAILKMKAWRVDGFITKPVETDHGVFDDAPDHTRTFWGVYVVRPWNLLPRGHIDLYYLGIDRKMARFDQGSGRETRHSAGARIWGGNSIWDYNFEVVYQWGSFGAGNIRAWTAASDNGYTLTSLRFRPRLGLKADVTSGDHDRNNPNLQTFNALFPKGAYFGEIALVGPANHIDLHSSVDLSLTEHLTMTADAVVFWRQSLDDGIYGNASNLLRSGRGSDARFVGSQPSLQLEWQINRHITVEGVLSHFFAGPFLRETEPGRDVDYVTSWITYKF